MKSHHQSIIICCIYFLYITSEVHAQTPKPTNLSVSNIKSCSGKLSWSPQPTAIGYEVRYKPDGLTQSPPVDVALNTFYTFTGLDASKGYTLKVAAKYPSNQKSKYAAKKIITSSCSLPENVLVISVDSASAQISWQGCPSGNFQVRYKINNTVTWNYIVCGSAMQVNLQPLLSDSTYNYQVCGCVDTAGNWTKTDTFTTTPCSNQTPSKPNIIVLLMDDARINTYSCQHAPSFFHTPSIDRICHEGAAFEDNYVTCSLCVPARSSLLTGLYPHHHGAIDLQDDIDVGIPTLPIILSQQGYYTAMVGKYHMSMNPVEGWDYWLATTSGGSYFNKTFNCNGISKKISGHSTDVITDSAVAVINRTAGNFFLWVAYNAPHDPIQPQTQYANSFENDVMPVKGNLDRYTINYPSFLYVLPEVFFLRQDSVDATTRHYYQCVAGVDSSVKRIRETLEAKGILDNTLIIITSDNGRIIGEHGLNQKIFPYEESIRTPLWVRYPVWFGDSTVVNDKVSLNIDVAPTILEAAGIEDTFHFDGISLRKLATGELSRNNVMYEYLYSTANFPTMPWIRSVRDSQYKYVKYGCNQITEEFFDIRNDSLELINLIKKSELQTVIQQYRDQMAQLRTQYGDTIKETLISCDLSNIEMSKLINEREAEDDQIIVSPNPAFTTVNISGNFSNYKTTTADLRIVNALGQLIFTATVPCLGGSFEYNLDCKKIKNGGEYFVSIKDNDSIISQAFHVIK
ncbi:MAG: sulfatase-like hydrolase/transferase [Chitinophagales bacterium]|nr:sulfatase-like hydrolase/transferase [Chitinophagales bacterium]